MKRLKSVLPGLILLLTIGLCARIGATVFPAINHLLFAILIGFVIGNSYGIPEWAKSGVATQKLLLETGIVLMGASVPVDRIISGGITILMLVVATILLTIFSVEVLSRGLFDIHHKIRSLLAVGASICGVSAVIAVAGSINASERDIAYAAATVLFFDAVTLFLFPIIGQALGLSDVVFGIWTGLTMFSTGPVAAAGFAFSKTAGEWALLIKLTRNALIGIAAIGYALYYTSRGETEDSTETFLDRWRYLWISFPKFVLGFLFVMFFVNIGNFDDKQMITLKHASNWLFLLAFSGLGLEIQLMEFKATGLKPILIVLMTLIMVSTFVLIVLPYIL